MKHPWLVYVLVWLVCGVEKYRDRMMSSVGVTSANQWRHPSDRRPVCHNIRLWPAELGWAVIDSLVGKLVTPKIRSLKSLTTAPSLSLGISNDIAAGHTSTLSTNVGTNSNYNNQWIWFTTQRGISVVDRELTVRISFFSQTKRRTGKTPHTFWLLDPISLDACS
jgi:hypothetical protein